MLFHKPDDGEIHVDIANGLNITSTAIPVKGGLKIGYVDINISSASFPAKFICSLCGTKDINLTDIIIYCQNCGEKIPVREAYRFETITGAYCEKCASSSNFSERKMLDLVSCLKKVNIR